MKNSPLPDCSNCRAADRAMRDFKKELGILLYLSAMDDRFMGDYALLKAEEVLWELTKTNV